MLPVVNYHNVPVLNVKHPLTIYKIGH